MNNNKKKVMLLSSDDGTLPIQPTRQFNKKTKIHDGEHRPFIISLKTINT